ncbi:Uncharacterised protein [Mycobacterium tuberculosis]|nr:Uncharacterised protein [Mycobacterium tuberculosis]
MSFTSSAAHARRNSTRFLPDRMRSEYFGLIDNKMALPTCGGEHSRKSDIGDFTNGLNRASDYALMDETVIGNRMR